MMYYALTLKGSLITGVHESAAPITSKTFERSSEYAEDTVMELAAAGDYQIGANIHCFNEDGTHKDLVWCIENGYMLLPPHMGIIKGVLVERTAPAAEVPITLAEKINDTESRVDSLQKTIDVIFGGVL